MNDSVETPFDCIENIKKARFQTLEELTNFLDIIAIKNKFQIIKKNGDKDYVYLYCHKSGGGRCIAEELKKRNNNSHKTSKGFPIYENKVFRM